MSFRVLSRLRDGSPEWLEQRRHGIGASDVAAILGESPFSTPYRIYLDKIGERWNPPRGEFLEWGHRLEPAIAQWVQDHHGELGKVVDGIDAQSVEYPWLCVKPDRLIGPERFVTVTRASDGARLDHEFMPLELKTSGEFMRGEWDTIPRHYLIQLLTQMIVMDAPTGYLAALIGGNKTAFFTVRRVEFPKLEARILEETEAFWKRVQRRDPPAPSEPAEAIHRWPGTPGSVLRDDGTVFDLLGEFMIAKADEKEAKTAADQLRTQILTEIENTETIVAPNDQVLATYKPQAGRKRLDWKQLEEDFPDAFEACVSTGEPTRVLRVNTKTIKENS